MYLRKVPKRIRMTHEAMTYDCRCEIYPEETSAYKSDGSNGFAVTINGSPLEYRPEQHYKITLQAKQLQRHI